MLAKSRSAFLPILGPIGLCMLGLVAGCTPPTTDARVSAAATTAPPNSAAVSAPVSLGDEASAVARNKITVTFPSGGSTLTASAGHELDVAARLFRDADPVMMFTTGYSDPQGDEFSNVVLSARRAEVVKRGLVARGIPAQRLTIQALGASELADKNDPGAEANRRVVVTWRLL